MRTDFGFSWLIPAGLATVALLFSLLSSFWCQTVKYDPSYGDSLASLHFGLFTYSKVSGVEVSWRDAEITTQLECATYSDNIDIDHAWKAARAFAVIVALFGFIVTLALWLVPCCSDRINSSATLWKRVITTSLIHLAFFQGLTFLILNSDLCEDNPLLILLGMVGAYEDGCRLGSGGIMNIVSILLWLLTGVAYYILAND